MTLFWMKPTRARYGIADANGQDATEAPEYDEDGRRYVFRYPAAPAPRYNIDRDRLFDYVASHRVPGMRERMIRRDQRNAANFFEDVRDIQTHPDVIPVVNEQDVQIAQLRLRSAS